MDRAPAHYAAILGASNLTFSLPEAVRWTLASTEGRRELFVAHGPGRSYGLRAGTVFARYVGLSQCALFERLERAVAGEPRPRVHALLTDIGNDLIYSASPALVEKWVAKTMDRLARLGARVAVTALPRDSLRRMPRASYYLFRTLYHPPCRIPYTAMMARVDEMQERLAALCAEREALFLPAPAEWYGLDHLHLKIRKRREAFRFWLGELFGREPSGPAKLGVSPLRLWLQPPSRIWKLALFERQYPQPGLVVGEDARVYLD